VNLSGKPITNPVVVLREEFDDWAILYNPDTADAIVTNPTGIAIWKLLDGTRTVEDLVVEVQARFCGVSQSAAGEVADFVRGLAQDGFVSYEVEGARS
jgi:SynChlorMet cassette protein ScmD